MQDLASETSVQITFSLHPILGPGDEILASLRLQSQCQNRHLHMQVYQLYDGNKVHLGPKSCNPPA